MPILWTQKLTVGVVEIDRQHREIFRRMDALAAALRGNDSREIARLFEFLGRYVVDHFGLEETWMRISAYPGYEAHKAAHHRFAVEYRQLMERYQAFGAVPSVTQALERWMGAWLGEHIAGPDQAMARQLLADQRRV